MCRKIWSIGICLSLLLALSACRQNTAFQRRVRNSRIAVSRIVSVSVSGLVLSDRDRPLRGVAVTAINLFDYVEKSASSDEFGNYKIEGLRSGEYHVCAEMYAAIKHCVTADPSWNGIDTAGQGILLDRDRTIDIKLKLRDD